MGKFNDLPCWMFFNLFQISPGKEPLLAGKQFACILSQIYMQVNRKCAMSFDITV